MKILKVNLRTNKANGQINFSIPKKKFSKKGIADLSKSKELKIRLEDFYFE